MSFIFWRRDAVVVVLAISMDMSDTVTSHFLWVATTGTMISGNGPSSWWWWRRGQHRKRRRKRKEDGKNVSDISFTKKSKLRSLWNENFEEDAPFVKLKRRKSENLLPN